MRQQFRSRERGSILIIVLWILLLISLLAGRYLSHNRSKAGAAAYGWKALAREQALASLLQLYATSGDPLSPVTGTGDQGLAENRENDRQETDSKTESDVWRSLRIGKIDLLVRESSESRRLNLNSAADDAIRNRLRQGLGDDRLEEADQVADALLDWRDPDDLVRSDGAEEDFYQTKGLPYEPADGPFKSLTEMLLVRGVTGEMFWGAIPDAAMIKRTGDEGGEMAEASNKINEDSNNGKDESENPAGEFSLINTFTISGKNVKRVEVIFPQEGGSALAITAFLQRVNRKWQLRRCYRCYLSMAEPQGN